MHTFTGKALENKALETTVKHSKFIQKYENGKSIINL